MRKVDAEEENLRRIHANDRLARRRNSNLSFYLKGIGIALALIAGYEGIDYLRLQREYERERHSALELADYFGDYDGVTSEEEWRNVYRKLLVQYDVRGPVELSVEQLSRYNEEMSSLRKELPARPKNIGNKKRK